MREGNFFWAGGHACGFLFNFSKVTENAIVMIKLTITKLKYHKFLCYTTDINL